MFVIIVLRIIPQGAITMTMAVRFLRRVYSSDYIEIHLEIYWKGDLSMLTVTDLIAVLALCATFYGLGYVHGQHDSKAKK